MMANEDDFLDEFGGSNEKNDNAVDGKQPDRNSDLDEMSSEELRQEIQQEKKKATRSLVLAVTALIAIIAICIAWFVANNVIKGGTSDVSAGTDSRFQIASKGVRQTAEQDYYLKDDSDTPRLGAGIPEEYDSYYDIESGSTITITDNESKIFNLGQSEIAWFQDGQTVFEPGASGKLEFYVLPKKSGLTSMTITLKTEAYYKKKKTMTTTEETDTSEERVRAARSDLEVLQNLIEGHILLFRHLNKTDGYSGWLEPTAVTGDDTSESGTDGHVFTITADEAGVEAGTFEAGTLYKVTVYWVWPKYFRNYIYDSEQNGDLFRDITKNGTGYNNADYESILAFIENQKTMGISGGSKLFYSKDNTVKNFTDQTIDSDMSDETLNLCDTYYNLADEYIGKNANFLYISATVD